jgi:competence protein ComEC
MILTHPHADHIEGLIEVLKRYDVDQVMYTGVTYGSSAYAEWKNEISNQNIPVDIITGPKEIKLGENMSLNILYPLYSIEGETVEELNNSSIVSKLMYGNTSFLFTGDMQMDAELDLLEQQVDVSADVLKVAHHGSKYSTLQGFLSAVSPKNAVISVGKQNDFGHPHYLILNRLGSNEIETLRTDELGTIAIQSDGEKFWVK